MGMLDTGESMDIEALGDLMKNYEMSEAGKSLMPGLPVIARLDGKNFSKFTKGLDKPFDVRFIESMDAVCVDLFEEFQPAVIYTQSDEITMAWNPVDPEGAQPMAFGGRVQKLVSLLAGRASSKFALEMVARLPQKALSGAVPSMDCRVWQFPTMKLAAGCFLWREADATKNSVSMLASKHFKHSELDSKPLSKRKEMLLELGVDWAALDARVKRGSFFFRRKQWRELSAEVMNKIPKGRIPEGGKVERSVIVREDLPPLGSLSNRVEVLFEGKGPVRIAEAEPKPVDLIVGVPALGAKGSKPFC